MLASMSPQKESQDASHGPFVHRQVESSDALLRGMVRAECFNLSR